MRSRAYAALLAVVLPLESTGCFTAATTQVDVRDPRDVSLSGPSGTVLPAGATPTETQVVLERGKYWDWLSRRPFEIRAVREPTGGVALRCDTCNDGFLKGLRGVTGTTYERLLDGTGRTRTTPSDLVDQIGGPVIHVGYDVCMRETTSDDFSFCDIPARLNLDVPTSDVIAVHRKVEPVRAWGYVLLGMGAAILATGVIAAASPAFGSRFIDRAPAAALLIVPGGLIAGMGAWEAFSPTQEQVWRPQ